MTEEQQETIESLIAQYPVCQYAFLKPEDLTFPERVRQICELGVSKIWNDLGVSAWGRHGGGVPEGMPGI
ncbi:MAG: hypothetical protein V8S12_03860 [Lachnospiraceae bacterium]